MVAKLSKLEIHETSVVPVGANPHAHIRLFKNDSAVTGNLKGIIAKLRIEDPAGTNHLSDLQILGEITGVEKAPTPATEAMTEAERKRRLDAKNKAGEAARHSVAAPGSSAVDGPLTKSATASGELTSGGVQHLFDLEVAKIAKRDNVGRGEAMDRLRKTEAGARLWRALDDSSIAAGPMQKANVPGPESPSVRKHIREAEERQASTARAYMDILAKKLRDTEAEAGRQISPEQAFTKIYEDPKNAVLQLRLRVEEGRA